MESNGKNIILVGASGMIGSLVLDLCLAGNNVNRIISLVRKFSGKQHTKLTEVVVNDFTNYETHTSCFQDVQVVFYCLGVYSGAVPKDEFRKITVDYPVSFAKALHKESPTAVFCLLSGQGADRTEKSSIMFARDKGAAENQLAEMGFSSFYAFRPSYIYPVEPRNEPNFSYRLMRKLYPLIKMLGKNFSIQSTELANAMYTVGMKGSKQNVFENRDILQLH